MAIAPIEPLAHPLLRCLGKVDDLVGEAGEFIPTYLPVDDKAAALLALTRLESELAALRLGVLACADDVAAVHGARDAAAWLAHEARLDRGPVRRDADLAAALDSRWLRVAAALKQGAVNLPQARVCVEILDELPDELDAELVAAVEEQLVLLAREWAPKDLKVLGRKVLEWIDPAVAEEHEARKLEDEERRAHESTRLSLHRVGDGTTRISGKLPDHVANRLATYLDAFTSPRRVSTGANDGGAAADGTAEPPVSSPDSRGPAHLRRGQAFCSLLELLDPANLPAHGGAATTIMITIGLDALRRRLGVGDLLGHDLDRLSAGEVRRLACTADLVPAVLGTDGEILDLGRASRLFSRAQRKAIRVRDKGCRAEGCDAPPAWTEAHHKRSWASGGATDLENAVSICSFHHHRIHDERYLHAFLPNGDVRFRRRT
jgi:hypothetical protein